MLGPQTSFAEVAEAIGSLIKVTRTVTVTPTPTPTLP